MNREKLISISCIILSIAFSLSLGLFIHFKLFLPCVSNVYEKIVYYPEDLYKDYQKEAEGMITRHEYTCQYPTEVTYYSKDGQTTLVIKIGEYNEGKIYSNYIIAIVKNFGTNEQEVTFERSRKNAEDAYIGAENYRRDMYILTAIFVLILVIFTGNFIRNSIVRCYRRVFTPMIIIVITIVICIVITSIIW